MSEIWSGQSKSLTNVATGGKISTATYRINDDYIYVDTGVLSSRGEQFPVWAVRDVDFMQSLVQKARNVATIRIRFEHNDFTGKPEILLENIEAGRELVAVINSIANTARLEKQKLSQTQNVNYQGFTPPLNSQTPQAGDDLVARLERLGNLFERGILTREEFDAQKAKILDM